MGHDLLQQRFQGVFHHEHRLAARLDLTRPEFDGVIDLERQQEQSIELIEPGAEVHRLQAGPVAPALAVRVAAVEPFVQPPVFLGDERLDVTAQPGHFFQNRRQAIREFPMAVRARGVRFGAEGDVRQIVLAPDQHAVLGQHLRERLLQRRAALAQQETEVVLAEQFGQHRGVHGQVVRALGVGGAGKDRGPSTRFQQPLDVRGGVRVPAGVVRFIDEELRAMGFGDPTQPVGLERSALTKL